MKRYALIFQNRIIGLYRRLDDARNVRERMIDSGHYSVSFVIQAITIRKTKEQV